jgi:hypothetical protein
MGMTLNQDKTKEIKQFNLVKYFALASFAVLIIFSFPFSIFISKKAKDTGLAPFF